MVVHSDAIAGFFHLHHTMQHEYMLGMRARRQLLIANVLSASA